MTHLGSNTRNIRFKYLVITIYLLVSCNTSEISPDEIYFGYDYFPLETGIYREYQVNETNWPGGQKTEQEYYIREVLEDAITDQAGDTVYVLRRYKKSSDTLTWTEEVTETWSIRMSSTHIVQNENNVNFVKLNFPVRNGSQWDGNAYNTMDSMMYVIRDAHNSYEFSGGSFDSSLSVIKNEFISLVEKDVAKEIYVKDIGMVYKEDIQLEYVNDENDPDYAQDVIIGGTEKYLRLINYGKE